MVNIPFFARFQKHPKQWCVSQISEPSTIPDLRIAVASQRPKARADCRSPRRIVPWFRGCLGFQNLGGWLGRMIWMMWPFFLEGQSSIYICICYIIVIYMYSRIYMIYLDIYIYTFNVHNRFRWYINLWSLSI